MQMRTKLLFMSCLLWLFTFASVAADTKPQQQSVVSQQQSETIYSQIFAMQNRLAQLEAGLQQQQSHTEDLKDAEKELQQLKVQLTRLEQQLSSQKEVQSNEVSVVSARVSDAQANMSWWFGMVGLFLTLLTLMLAFVGFLTYQRSKDTALQQIQDFLKTEKPLLLKEAKTDILQDAEREIELVRKQLTNDFTQKWEEFLEPLQKQAEQFFNREKLNSTHDPENELSDEQKRQLAFATTLKPVSEFTAKDWYNRSTSELANGDYKEALKSIEQALTYINALPDYELARFLFRKAICFHYLNDFQQEITVYDELIQMYATSPNVFLEELIANAMLNKGYILAKLNQLEQELGIYDELISTFGSSTNPTIQEQVAKARLNKGVSLRQLGQPKDALETYESLIPILEGSTIFNAQELKARAILGLGACLTQLNQPNKSILIHDELIAALGGSTDLLLQELVVEALANQAEAALLVGSKSEILQRITACEDKTNDPQIVSVMQLLRFIIDDKSINAVLETLKAMSREIEVNWSFNEIKSYLEQNLTGKKLLQCKAVIAFFEDHKDIQKLESELKNID